MLSVAIFATLVCVACDWKNGAHKPIPQESREQDWRTLAVKAQSTPRIYPRNTISLCAKLIDMPSELVKHADISNYGQREMKAEDGSPLPNKPTLIILHETVIGERETIELFSRPHSNEEEQVSYHVLISKDGRIIRLVEDEKRAFGAGMSHFGGLTIRKKKESAGSINNIALHASLVSPGEALSDDHHSGYTEEQYKTLAKQVLIWQMKFGIPMVNVTTHQSVDRSHSRYDPRSFDWDKFDKYHGLWAKTCNSIAFSQQK